MNNFHVTLHYCHIYWLYLYSNILYSTCSKVFYSINSSCLLHIEGIKCHPKILLICPNTFRNMLLAKFAILRRSNDTLIFRLNRQKYCKSIPPENLPRLAEPRLTSNQRRRMLMIPPRPRLLIRLNTLSPALNFLLILFRYFPAFLTLFTILVTVLLALLYADLAKATNLLAALEINLIPPPTVRVTVLPTLLAVLETVLVTLRVILLNERPHPVWD